VVEDGKRRGAGLFLVAVCWAATAAAAPFVYVTDAIDDTVSVIDTATDTVTATVPVGDISGVAIDPLAVSPDGRRVYVALVDGIAVLDTSTQTVRTTVSGLYLSGGIAVDPSGSRIYVVNATDPGSVSTIDATSYAVAGTVQLTDRGSLAMAISPDGSRAYVTNTFDDIEQHHCRSSPLTCPLTVDVVELQTGRLLPRVDDVGAFLMGIAVNSSGTRVYVAQYNLRVDGSGITSGMAVIEPYPGICPPPPFFCPSRVAARVPGIGPGVDVAVHPTDACVYVTGGQSDATGGAALKVVDAGSNRFIRGIPLAPRSSGERSYALALNPAGSRAYVSLVRADGKPSRVAIVDTIANTLEAYVTVGHGPNGIRFVPDPQEAAGSAAAAAPVRCPGDCDSNGSVTVDELVQGVNIALGGAGSCTCAASDANGDGTVTVDELVTAINNALNACPP